MGAQNILHISIFYLWRRHLVVTLICCHGQICCPRAKNKGESVVAWVYAR